MSNIVELRPNRQLLNVNFEKYQFQTDEIRTKCEKKLDTGKYVT